MSEFKVILGAIAVLMTIAAHIPYLVTTIKGTNRPHIFTWIIWTLLTFIAFAVQYAGHAGPGAWVTFATGVLCAVILITTFRNGDWQVTRGDWVMFLGSLAAIPLWLVTQSPLWSILLVTGIDCSAFGPTFGKAWKKPHEENSFMYGFNIPRHVISIVSIAQFSILTVLYPASLLIMNIVMYAMLKARRKVNV